MALHVGQQIWIPCTVQPGRCSEEALITFVSIHGPVTGFVSNAELGEVLDLRMVRGVIRAMEKDHLEVWIQGSFSTTNGLASVPNGLAIAA